MRKTIEFSIDGVIPGTVFITSDKDVYRTQLKECDCYEEDDLESVGGRTRSNCLRLPLWSCIYLPELNDLPIALHELVHVGIHWITAIGETIEIHSEILPYMIELLFNKYTKALTMAKTARKLKKDLHNKKEARAIDSRWLHQVERDVEEEKKSKKRYIKAGKNPQAKVLDKEIKRSQYFKKLRKKDVAKDTKAVNKAKRKIKAK